MFCPKCGQQQIADHTRFCSRCGLALSGMGEYLAGDAVLPVRKDVQTMAANSAKRKGIRRGAKVMFFGGVLAPICFGLCFLVDGPGPLLIPITVFMTGLVVLLYTLLFAEEISPATSHPSQPFMFSAMPETAALPPASNMSIDNSGGRRVRTSELARPSVTEHTTRLLDRDQG